MDTNNSKSTKSRETLEDEKHVAAPHRILGCHATSEEIEAWHQPITPENFLLYLIPTLETWISQKADLEVFVKILKSCKNCQLTEKDAASLLSWKPPKLEERLDHCWEPTLMPLIFHLMDRVTNPDELLHLIETPNKSYNLNALSCAVIRGQIDAVQYLCTRFDKDTIFYLLSQSTTVENGGNALHFLAYKNIPIVTDLICWKSSKQIPGYIGKLLSLRDNNDRTVLSVSISQGSKETFASILRFYLQQSLRSLESAATGGDNASDTKSELKLWEIAAIPDNRNKTAYHYAEEQDTQHFLISLLKSTSFYPTAAPKDVMIDILKEGARKRGARSEGGKGAKKPRKEISDAKNKLICQWTREMLEDNKYLMFENPKVLVFYITKDREGGDEEAEQLISCFREMSMDVERFENFTQFTLIEAIKRSLQSESSLNAFIVAIMAHGYSGHINDFQENPMSLSYVEELMCPSSHTLTPKLMIVQTCQNVPRTNRLLETSTVPSTDHLLYRQSTSHTSQGSRVFDVPVEDAGPARNWQAEVFAPRKYNFGALMSTVPDAPSRRNLFIPILVEVLRCMPSAESISLAMNKVKEQVFRNTSIPKQIPSFLDNLGQSFCLKSSLPAYLSRSRGPFEPHSSLDLDGIADNSGERTEQSTTNTGTQTTPIVESQASAISGIELTSGSSAPQNKKNDLQNEPIERHREFVIPLHSPTQSKASSSSVTRNSRQHAPCILENSAAGGCHTTEKGSPIITEPSEEQKLSHSIYHRKEPDFLEILDEYLKNDADASFLLDLLKDEMNKLNGLTVFQIAADLPETFYLENLFKAFSKSKDDTRNDLLKILVKSYPVPSWGQNQRVSLASINPDAHPSNGLIIRWEIDSLTQKRYTLFDQPSVVIIYSKGGNRAGKKRQKSTEEANMLSECFRSMGLTQIKLSKDFRKENIFELIKTFEQHRLNGQIVCLLSHGTNGYIIDDEGVWIPLSDIEEAITGDKNEENELKYQNTPKLLMLQCCQDRIRKSFSHKSTQFLSEDNPKSDPFPDTREDGFGYIPKNPDLLVAQSCGPCNKSREMIFVEQFCKALENDAGVGNITEAIQTANREVDQKSSNQRPVQLSRLGYSFCLKGILPIFLNDERWRCSCYI